MIEVLKQALDVLDDIWNSRLPLHNVDDIRKAKASLSQAIKELESQEPFEDLATELFVVAQVSPADNGFSETIERIESWLREHFTHPPQRTWVGLTDEDKKQMAKEANYHWEMTAGEYAERIGQLTEAKLKEKNT